ncbi:AAA family ATPase [Propionibacteriaceae bacterium G1746]
MWRRPDPPTVLAAVADELQTALSQAWAQASRTRAPALDPVLGHPEVVRALARMTDGCCAYCERALPESGPDSLVVAHHRPAWGAVGLDGSVDLDAYHWLSYEWTNLYPACADCVRSRGSRFPVDGARAPQGQPADDEDALLVDPLTDDPATFLRFEADGTVTALASRGTLTIDQFALNRDALVRARRGVIEGIRSSKSSPGADFRTLRRQYAQPSALVPQLVQMIGPSMPPTAGAEPGEQGYYATTAWIERIVIKNFRPIRDIELDLSRSTSDEGPWTVLLGENGSGKSSILHAIALTMMGGEARRELGIDARKYLRHRARKGLVQVWLQGRGDPLELVWGSGDAMFSGPHQVPALLLGYGATRLLPRLGASPATDTRRVRVDSLFDPLRPLTDPTSWLLSLDEDTFGDVAAGIHDLLALDRDSRLVRRRGKVVLRAGKDDADLTTLSDGYQSMVVMSCDILRSVLLSWSTPALAEGIVLIDEVGAHLHPRWRLRVVGALRRLMPRVQFIVTTHEPLCLRGVRDGEVVVVRRNTDGEVITITDLPPVSGMRIDQLLTSEHFGLGATDDPEVDELWEAYYRLQARKQRTAADRAELARVEARLGELQQLGATERERLVLTAASQYIAQRRETGDTVAAPPSDVTDKLAKLWAKHLPGEV